MGVALDLLGKNVRCPHCKQVVLAPTASSAGASAQPKPTPPQPSSAAVAPQSPQVQAPPVDDEPIFRIEQREAADSILSEPGESEDEIFGSPGGNRAPIPTLPELPPPAPPVLQPSAAVFQQPTAAPVLTPLPAPVVSAANPFAFESDPQPAPAVAAPQIAAPQPPVVTPLPQPVAVVPVPAPAAAPEQPAPPKARRGDRAASPGGGGISKALFFGVAGYALIMTLAAAYGLFIKSGEKVDPGHPLSTIPDTLGEFDPASRKKVSLYRPSLDGELPASQMAELGGRIAIGQLEIEPLKVELRPLTIVSEGLGEKRKEQLRKAVVLHLRIKNTSSDLNICPMDPAFTRKVHGDAKQLGTRLVVGKQTFYGGAIDWPFTGGKVKRKYEAEQEQDALPLKPAESRDYVVFTDADPQIVKAVSEAGEAMLWRVQVRRGVIDFQGKETPVTAIIGVEFTSADVKSAG
jgi:hypothetical protein